MCDCCHLACIECGAFVASHIADFCVQRSSVRVICSQCLDNISSAEDKGGDGFVTKKVFFDTVLIQEQVEDAEGNSVGLVGQPVVFLVDDEKAYGVHLN